MKISFSTTLALAFVGVLSLVPTPTACAQVPDRLGYRGTVALDGQPFSGPGRFKFAIIDTSGSETFWSNDGSSRAGSEPQRHLEVPVLDGTYEVVLGDPSEPGHIALTSAVFTHPEVRLRIWFSDGAHPFQHLAPDEPFQPSGYALMAARVAAGAVTADALAPGAVTAAKIAPGAILENLLQGPARADTVQFSLSATNATLIAAGLSPVGSFPVRGEAWSMSTFGVPPPRTSPTLYWTGSEVLVVGGATSESSQYSPPSGYRFVPGQGTYLPLPTNNAPRLPVSPPNGGSLAEWVTGWTGDTLLVLNTRSRSGRRCAPADARWSTLPIENSPSIRSSASAVWTGTEWIVWGGLRGESAVLQDGARYLPASNTWISMSVVGAPQARAGHRALWTGTRMLVFGGEAVSPSATTALNDVWSYDPVADTWKQISNGTGIRLNTAGAWGSVWTGSELVVFGASSTSATVDFSSGARLNLNTGRWQPLASLSALAGLNAATAVWTGSEVVVWGGYRLRSAPDSGYAMENRGFAWSAERNAWREIANVDSPVGRTMHGAVWTGTEMVVWGGGSFPKDSQSDLADGGRYFPDRDRWLRQSPPPLQRVNPDVGWTGTELLVWGGLANANSRYGLNTGARYQPVPGRWLPMSTRNAPSPRTRHSASWTGREWVVWGGYSASSDLLEGRINTSLNNGARYDPSTDRWSSLTLDDAPSARGFHSAVWTGRELIVWGGESSLLGNLPLNTGGRYDPATGRWSPISRMLGGAELPGRSRHAAVWTGREMLVWGGVAAGNQTAIPGLRYDPASDSWSQISRQAAPGPSNPGVALWVGNEMLAWGGRWARYDPQLDSWRSVSTQNRIIWNTSLMAVSSGPEALFWGGTTAASHRYSPDTDTWTRFPVAGAPEARTGHALAWTGDSLLIVGGTEASAANRPPQLTRVLPALGTTRPIYVYGVR